jgi:phosphoglycolate phosphatase
VKLLLFDIDGTLVLTGGAGLRGMTRAFQHLFGVPDALKGVPVAGRTDPAILDEILSRANVAVTPEVTGRFQDTYLPLLAEEMETPSGSPADPSHHSNHKGPLPGVREIVAALAGRDDVFLALLTGNFTKAAEIKLGYFDLWRPFRCGAFGEDAVARHELVPVALARAQALGCPPVAPSDVIVIGDTPLDVLCAKNAGVRCLAVATGGYDRETLAAAGAHHAVETLEDTAGIVGWITDGSRKTVASSQ